MLQASLVLLLSLMSKAVSDPPPLVIGIPHVPTSWSLAIANDISLNKIAMQVVQGVVELDSSGNPQPLLAKSWQLNVSDLSILFELKKNLHFSDGKPLTSQDVLNSWVDTFRQGGRAFELIKNFNKCTKTDCDSFEILSDHSFKVHISSGNFRLFFKQLGHLQAAVGKYSTDILIGTGPLKISHIDKDKVLLERWAKKPSYPRKIIFQVIDRSRAQKLFENGQLDELNDLEHDVKTSVRTPNTPFLAETPVTYALYFNIKNGPFKKKKVRQHFRYLFQPEVHFNKGQFRGRVAQTFLPPGLAQIAVDLKKPNSVPKMAHGTPQVVVLGVRNQADRISKSTLYIVSILEKMNLKVNIFVGDFGKLLREFKNGRLHLLIKGDSPPFFDPSSFYSILATTARENISGYSNPKLDKLITQSIERGNISDVSNIYSEIERLISEDLPLIPLYHPEFRFFYRPYLAPPWKSSIISNFWSYPYNEFTCKNEKCL